MALDLVSLVEDLRKRPTLPATGAHFALDYLLTIEPHIKGRDVVTEFGLIGTAEQWATAIKEAAGKLVWVDPDGEPCSLAEAKVKAKGDEAIVAEPTDKAIFDGVTILTSKSKDRDRDVLHPDGADIDQKMPWLWQHIPTAPIGKYVQTVVQNTKQVKVHFALANTPLAQDAATLLDFKALRTSHGFMPKEWRELPTDKDGTPNGYEILKYHVYEGSSVSIPSNTDAVLTAASRQKLTTPLVKAYAAGLAAKRPSSVTVPKEVEEIQRTAPQLLAAPAPVAVNINLGEALSQSVAKGMGYSDMFPGSWGATECELEEALPQHLRVNGIDVRQYDMCRIRAMYQNSAIVVHYKSGDAGWDENLYRVGWTGSGDTLAWKGEPKPLEMQVAFVEKQKELHQWMRQRAVRVASADALGSTLLGKMLAKQGEPSLGVALALADTLAHLKESNRRAAEEKAWDALGQQLR